MDSEEVEYQCSDCGSTIQADTDVCQKCGALLEDLLVEDEFERIPITSDVVDITIIESLMKENNIEYFINNNSLDLVFGLPKGHNSTLMVHKEQVDLVRQILINYEKDIPLASKTVEQQSSLKGVGGWLLFFCVYLIVVAPLMSLPFIIDYIVETRDDFNLYPGVGTILDIDLVLNILMLFYGIYVGINLLRIRPDAVRSAILYLNVIILYMIAAFIIIIIVLQISEPSFNQVILNTLGYIMKETIFSIGLVIIWISYMKNSERVKNTYGV